MYINNIYFPQIKEGKTTELFVWFNWSNKESGNHHAFIQPQLLLPVERANYAAVEQEGCVSILAVLTNQKQAEAEGCQA